MALKRIALSAAVVFLCWSPQIGAYPLHKGDYAFWRQMPEAAQVVKDVIGTDDLDTAVRRHAAFVWLIQLVNVSADGKGKLPWPAREQALNNAYSGALPDLHALGGNETSRINLLFAQSLRLQSDPSFTRPLLKRYFSAAALREIEPIVSAFEAQNRKELARTEAAAAAEAPATAAVREDDSHRAVVGFIGASLGLGLIVLGVRLMRSGSRRLAELQKYEFEHMTSGGVVTFATYEDSKRHEVNKMGAMSTAKLGLAPLVVGAILMFFVVINSVK